MSIFYPDNITSRTALPASGISSDSNLLLNVSYGGTEHSLTLAELKKTPNLVTVANVAALYALNYAIDNQLYMTLGYTNEGIGANLYRYDAGSSATPDYGFTLDGIGGNGSGTGTGRFIAIDRTVARPEHFGAIKHSTFATTIFANATGVVPSIGAGFDSTVPIQRCMDAAETNIVNVLFEPGLYFVTNTINLPTQYAWTATSSTLFPVMKITGYGAEIRSNFNGPIFSHTPTVGQENNTRVYYTLNIEGFHFWGPYDFEQAPLKTSSVGIYYYEGYSTHIQDCRFTRLYQGIRQIFVLNSAIDRCRFDECSNGIRCSESGGGYTAIRECRFYGEDPNGIAYWFYTGPGLLENCISEGFRVKYPIVVGSDSAGGGLVKVKQFHLESPALHVIRANLAQYCNFDLDGLTLSGKTGFINSSGTSEEARFSFRDIYDPIAYGPSVDLTTWSATSFAQYLRVQHSGVSYYANTACVAGDVPGVSPNWTSTGVYKACMHNSSLGRTSFTLTDSPTVLGETWFLNPSSWTDNTLPRHFRFDSPTANSSVWGWQQVVGKAHLTISGATPNVEAYDNFRTVNVSPTTITDFIDRASAFNAGPWREINLFINDVYTTIAHGASIQLSSGVNFYPSGNAMISFISHENVWYEKGRAKYS